MADYPNTITDPRVVANKPGTEYDAAKTTRLFAEDHNGLADEIVAIQTELGTNPKGTKTDVKTRISDIETLVPSAPFIKTENEIYKNAEARLINDIYGIITPDNIVGLWIFDPTTGTTILDRGMKAHDLTLNSDASTLSPNKIGLAPNLSIPGVSVTYSAGDHADFSFGNGSADSAFSIVSLCKQTAVNKRSILSKYDLTTGATKREFRFFEDSSSNLLFSLYDESASAVIARRYLTNKIPTNAWATYFGTYAGNSLATGIKMYLNGLRVDDNTFISGTYVAMENTTASLASYELGSTGMPTYGFTGSQSVIILAKEELTATQVKRLDFILKGYANLTL